MSDNLQISQGTGTTIATDVIGSTHYQRVKLTWGADGTADDASAASPLPVTAGKAIAIAASITRPNDTTAYAAGDAITDSTSSPTALAFSGAARVNGGTGVVVGATLIDSANQSTKGDFDLFLFEASYTPDNDNSGVTPTDSELETCIGVIRFSAGDFVVGDASSGASGNALCLGPVANPFAFTCGGGSTSLYGALVARSAYTPVANEKFTIRLRILQD